MGCFRVTSSLFPLVAHPTLGYDPTSFPAWETIHLACNRVYREAQERGIRLTTHPGQYTILNTLNPSGLQNSLRDLNTTGYIAQLIGIDVINIHGGSRDPHKLDALKRLADNLALLNPEVRKRLSLENCDKVYTPGELIPFCHEHDLLFCYDVHHHRCYPDGLSVREVTDMARTMWGERDPLFHVSSPAEGWLGRNPRSHHDYIDSQDFPSFWRDLPVTVEVEAKMKEKAVLKLQRDLQENSSCT